ncbi:MAG: indole-3-glycerol phosphate synthase TrpC [Thermomicrobiales bacterium]|nr:indole-3-glycerol phosphate synthase TrpC [Thermomicrobiales bacterium]
MLDRILARTAADVAVRKTETPLADLETRARARPAPVDFPAALAAPGMAVIAEIKRASPSRGTFPVTVNPAQVAAEYLAGGAAALSVLTDEPFFQGSLRDLEAAAAVAHANPRPAPVLRKDFTLDPFQVVEARAYGADTALLIVAALSDDALAELLAVARSWGMEPLVEVHDETELERALAVNARVIGINNRDLRTFTVDLDVTKRLAPLVPPAATVVSESGVFDCAQIVRLARAGAQAVLVGEGLVTAPDRAAAVRALRSCPEAE